MYPQECVLSDKGDRYRASLGADTVGRRLTASRSGKGRLPALALRHPKARLRMARAQAAVVGQLLYRALANSRAMAKNTTNVGGEVSVLSVSE